MPMLMRLLAWQTGEVHSASGNEFGALLAGQSFSEMASKKMAAA